MSLKMKLSSAIIMFILILATLVIGVMAAQSQSIKLQGNVTFNINDRSLFVKSVQFQSTQSGTEGELVNYDSFLPGYVNEEMSINIGTQEVNYSSMRIYFNIINATKNTYIADSVTLSSALTQAGIEATISGAINPTPKEVDEQDYATISVNDAIDGQIIVDIISSQPQSQPYNLEGTIINIVQATVYEGLQVSDGVLTSYTGSGTVVEIPSSYSVAGDLMIEGNDYSITSIGASAFANNTQINSVTIAEGIDYIADSAFSGCSSLSQITIPASLTEIGTDAFTDCTSLQNVYYNGTINQWANNIYFNDSMHDLNPTMSGSPSYQIQYSNPLRNGAALNIDGQPATTVTITENISDAAFWGCSSLTDVTISEGVTYIGYATFADCANLTDIEIPNSVEYIGTGAFLSALEDMYTINPNFNLNEYVSGGYTSYYLGNSTNPYLYLVQGFHNIHSSCEFIGMYSGVGAIYDVGHISTPSTLKNIDPFVFSGQEFLLFCVDGTVNGVAGGGGEAVISGCPLYFSWIPDSTPIFLGGILNNYWDMTGDQSTNLSINSPLISRPIEFGIFEFFASPSPDAKLTSLDAIIAVPGINLPSNMTVLGDYSLAYAGGMLSELSGTIITVDFGTNSNLEMIGNYALAGTNIATITIPSGVTWIGRNAFENCTRLNEVVIDSGEVYTQLTDDSEKTCGGLITNANTIKVRTSVVSSNTNSFLTDTSLFARSTEGNYTVFTRV